MMLYEKLFPYQNQRPESVSTANARKRPMSSHPSLTTAQSHVPPALLNRAPSARFVMEDGTTIGSPSKTDQKFMPARARTSQGTKRIKSSTLVGKSGNTRMFKAPKFPGGNDISGSSWFDHMNQKRTEYSNQFINRRFIGTPSEGLRPTIRTEDGNYENFSIQNNINNMNVNINLEAPKNTKQFVPVGGQPAKRIGTAPGIPRSVSLKQFNMKGGKGKKRLKISARNK